MNNLPALQADSAEFIKLMHSYNDTYDDIAKIKENPDSDNVTGYAIWEQGQWRRVTPDALADDMRCLFIDGNPSVARPTPIVNEAFKTLTAYIPTTFELDWDRSLSAIPFREGHKSLCLKTGDIIDTEKDHRMFRKFNLKSTEIATKDEYENSRFKAFIEDWLEDPDRRRFVQQATAQALCGNPRQTIMDMWGIGRNGKGAYFQFLKAVAGEFCISIDTKFYTPGQSKHESEKTRLKYARYAIIGEFEAGAKIDTALLKGEVGKDGQTLSKKGKDGFEVVAQALYMIHGNADLQIRDRSKGIQDRWRVVKFTKTYGDDERIGDDEMSEITKSERGVFMYWLIEGLKEFRAAGNKYVGVETVLTDTANKFLDENVVEQILRRYCVRIENGRVDLKELLNTCIGDGESPWKGTATMFRAFKEANQDVHRNTQGAKPVVDGWILRSDAYRLKLIKEWESDDLQGTLDEEGKFVAQEGFLDDQPEDPEAPAPKRIKSAEEQAKLMLAKFKAEETK